MADTYVRYMLSLNPAYLKNHRLDHDNEYEPSVECPTNVELEGKIDHIQLTRVSIIKTFFFVLGVIATGGLLALLALWMPKVRALLTLKKSTIDHANKVVVFGAGKSNRQPRKNLTFF